MVQIDYEITIFYKAFFIKKFLSGVLPLDPPVAIVGVQAPPYPPVGVWGPNTVETRHLSTRKIIRLHTQHNFTHSNNLKHPTQHYYTQQKLRGVQWNVRLRPTIVKFA